LVFVQRIGVSVQELFPRTRIFSAEQSEKEKRMYALFFENEHHSSGMFDSKMSAMVRAKALSRERNGTVTCIFHRPGAQSICFRYAAGVHTFDGGCCADVAGIER
jgi:hypothetical protein